MDPFLFAFVSVCPHLNDHRGTNVLVGPLFDPLKATFKTDIYETRLAYFNATG